MPAIGWVADVAAADLILTDRLENASWFASGMTSARKTAALKTAQKRIVYSGVFDVSFTTPTTIALQEAQCEMAYYLVQQQAAEDRRLALQAQGVTAAGIVKETYDPAARGQVVIPPMVRSILSDLALAAGGFFVASIDRDEDDLVTDKQEDGVNA